MDGSHIPPGPDWLKNVRRLGELIRLHSYEEPHAGELATLMTSVITQSEQLSTSYQFEYLRLLHDQVMCGALSDRYASAVELLIINRLLRLYQDNDEYSRYLIGRKCTLLHHAPWLGSPGEAASLARALKQLTPPSKTKRTLYFLLEVGVRYLDARRQSPRK